MLTRVSAALFATAVALVPTARAEIANGKVRIGVLTDLSGGYEQNSGNGSVEAARIAAEEFGNKVRGLPVEILSGDHQNKPDVGASVAARWFDVEKVDAITDLVTLDPVGLAREGPVAQVKGHLARDLVALGVELDRVGGKDV